MSRHHHRRGNRHHHEGGERRSGSCWVNSVIHRVIRGSKEATGLGRGAVITLYVLGFIFMPLLTSIVFLGMWFWTTNPDKAREGVDRFTDHVKKAGKHFTDATMGNSSRRSRATEPEFDFDDDSVVAEQPPQREQRAARPSAEEAPAARAASPKEMRERFESLERRAQAIEEFVASEEYRLEREFKKMDK